MFVVQSSLCPKCDHSLHSIWKITRTVFLIYIQIKVSHSRISVIRSRYHKSTTKNEKIGTRVVARIDSLLEVTIRCVYSHIQSLPPSLWTTGVLSLLVLDLSVASLPQHTSLDELLRFSMSHLQEKKRRERLDGQDWSWKIWKFYTEIEPGLSKGECSQYCWFCPSLNSPWRSLSCVNV